MFYLKNIFIVRKKNKYFKEARERKSLKYVLQSTHVISLRFFESIKCNS